LTLLLAGFAALLGSCSFSGLFRQRTGNEPTSKTATLMLEGNVTPVLSAAPLFEQGQHVERLSLLIKQRHLEDGQPDDHVGTRS
jgi:hypothetical protein